MTVVSAEFQVPGGDLETLTLRASGSFETVKDRLVGRVPVDATIHRVYEGSPEDDN